MQGIYEKIGGKAGVDVAVDKFYEYMLADDRVKHFFNHVNMEKQRERQKAFIIYALGGSDDYTGKNMRDAHQHLVDEHGLNDIHFDATAENLIKTLKYFDVSDEMIEVAAQVIESYRADILCR